ncbi:MAG: hypothetical protein JWR61_1325 [Ferruginibacter sp.]|nr:hypothetical protein [Ferruginibacter sp.]
MLKNVLFLIYRLMFLFNFNNSCSQHILVYYK